MKNKPNFKKSSTRNKKPKQENTKGKEEKIKINL